jgi:simple sugar transport system ATP-binding protein
MPEDGKLVEMKGIVKRFPGVIANDHVDFELERGEVHALLGENGAGKTTLMNILYGLYTPDAGKIVVKGKEVTFHSPKVSIKLGIGMVHQNLKLVLPHTVTENIILGLDRPRLFLNLKEAEERVRKLASKYGWKIDPKTRIWQLSVGERQQVEILKLLYRDADILIMDEPTSVLTPQETRRLFGSLRAMAEEGRGVIYITHKLEEVFAVCDRVTVMRKGKVVATRKVSETTKEELAKLMVGRPVLFMIEKKDVKPGKVVLEVRDVRAYSDKGLMALNGVSFYVRRHEILGIAGVTGNGQKELAEVITGLRKAISGKVIIEGKDMTNKSVKRVLEEGVAFIPEERVGVGTVPNITVAENLVLRTYRYAPFSNRIFLNLNKIGEYAEELIKKFSIATPSKDLKARFLSGGNLQKVVIARELTGLPNGGMPKLIVAMHPTRGLDVGATEYVRNVLVKYRDAGCAVLLISEDLEEIMGISDRIAVIYEGRIMGIVDRKEADIEDIGLMMAGTPMGEIKR